MTTSTSTSTSRVQLALNVRDVEAATRFYADMFGVPPAKQRPGYANFVVADPPLKLVLFENQGSESALNHLGVEMPSSDEVVAATRRFAEAGLAHTTAEVDACCHAVQDKAWVEAPDVPLGAWEFYTVLADDPEVEPLFHLEQFLDFAFHQPADGNVRPFADHVSDVFFVDLFLQHALVFLELGQTRLLVLDFLFEFGHGSVLEL